MSNLIKQCRLSYHLLSPGTSTAFKSSRKSSFKLSNLSVMLLWSSLLLAHAVDVTSSRGQALLLTQNLNLLDSGQLVQISAEQIQKESATVSQEHQEKSNFSTNGHNQTAKNIGQKGPKIPDLTLKSDTLKKSLENGQRILNDSVVKLTEVGQLCLDKFQYGMQRFVKLLKEASLAGIYPYEEPSPKSERKIAYAQAQEQQERPGAVTPGHAILLLVVSFLSILGCCVSATMCVRVARDQNIANNAAMIRKQYQRTRDLERLALTIKQINRERMRQEQISSEATSSLESRSDQSGSQTQLAVSNSSMEEDPHVINISEEA